MESHLRTSSVGISSLAVKDVTTHGVEAAIEQFRRTGLEAMLEKYGGGPSTKWYLEVGRSRYDQKLVVRAAHVLQRLGDLPPLVPGDFTAGHARYRLERLGYRVVPRLSQTDENLYPSAGHAGPKGTASAVFESLRPVGIG